MIDSNPHKPVTVDVKHTALYKKALCIYKLSRKLNKNKYLQEISSHHLNRFDIYEEVILLSIRLPYTIALAQTSPNYYTKLDSSTTILKSIALLKTYCTELRRLHFNGTDLTVLTQELQTFAKMFHKWRLILTQQN